MAFDQETFTDLLVLLNSAMVRATVQLMHHTNGDARISIPKLLNLIDSMNLAIGCLIGLCSNPSEYQLPLSSLGEMPVEGASLTAHISNNSSEYYLVPWGFEIVRELARLAFPTSPQQNQQIQRVAEFGLGSIALVLSGQLSASSFQELRWPFITQNYLSEFFGDWLIEGFDADEQARLRDEVWDTWLSKPTGAAPSERLLVNQRLAVASLFILREDWSDMVLDAIPDILGSLARSDSMTGHQWQAVWHLVKATNLHGIIQQRTISTFQLRMLRLVEKLISLTGSLHMASPDQLGSLLLLLANLPFSASSLGGFGRIFDGLKPTSQNQDIALPYYLRTWSGLLLLMLVARNRNDRQSVIDVITAVIRTATDGELGLSQQLSESAMNSFLAAVHFVLRFRSTLPHHELVQFARGALFLLQDHSIPSAVSTEQAGIDAKIQRTWDMISAEALDMSLEGVRARLSAIEQSPPTQEPGVSEESPSLNNGGEISEYIVWSSLVLS